jgi:hypothetical protein
VNAALMLAAGGAHQCHVQPTSQSCHCIAFQRNPKKDTVFHWLLQVWNSQLVAVQFAALKRLTGQGGMQLLPEKVEVLPSPPGAPTYTLRIISRIAFNLWDWKRWVMW